METSTYENILRVAHLAEAGGVESLDPLFELLRAGYGSFSRLKVNKVEFLEVTAAISKVINRFPIQLIRERANLNRVQFVLAAWLYKMHRDFQHLETAHSHKQIDWSIGEQTILSLRDIGARLDLVTYGERSVDMYFSVTPLDGFPQVDMKVGIRIGKRLIHLEPRGEEAGHYLFSQEINQSPTFHASIDLQGNEHQKATVVLTVVTKGESIEIPLATRMMPATKLTTVKFQRVYRNSWEFQATKFGISWRRYSSARRLQSEALYILTMAKRSMKSQGPRAALRLVFLRLAYWAVRPIWKNKKIWVTHDKMFSAGDSGEYMYKFLARTGQVTPYYVINPDSLDLPRLRSEGVRTLFPRTLIHLLVYLNADVMLETHKSPDSYNRFTGEVNLYFRDLVKFRILGIQHGLNVHDVSKSVHLTHSGIERLYCASEVELVNVLSKKSGFDLGQISLAGCARFDGQWDPNSREILIAPTWRQELTGASRGISKMRDTFDGFTATKFFNLYKEIITNKQLLDSAERNGFTVRFMLHPLLASNLQKAKEDIQNSLKSLKLSEKLVAISAAGVDLSFDEALKRCAMIVTDYSGVQFDVAYAAKPVIYFHSEDLPAQFDHGAMDYPSLGFGPICEKPKQVVKELEAVLERDGAISEFYKKRVEDFFMHRDANNCARIYADAYEFAYGTSP